jgi:hypothetical protein
MFNNIKFDSRYLEFDGTMEKIRVNRSSTQEELRRYRKRDYLLSSTPLQKVLVDLHQEHFQSI